MTPELDQWSRRGEFLESTLSGHRVFCIRWGDPAALPGDTLLILHGFPESSYSFHKVIEGLAGRFGQVVLFDMLGYGLSDKPVENYGYSLFEQADLALQVWRQLGVTGGHLLAHDMGDSVATELAARQVGGTLPGWFRDGFGSFTFTNGSMVLGLARLRVSQRLLLSRFGPRVGRMFNFRVFSQQVRSAHGAEGLDDKDLELLWDNICQNGGQFKNYLTIRYLLDRRRFEKTRWLPSLARVGEPIHLCWGEADAVARVEMAHYLKANVCTGARVTLMPGVGHFCQLSDPEIWLQSVCAFYDKP
jgi:pimeloyl-ACP methyl ester carboxylesterase